MADGATFPLMTDNAKDNSMAQFLTNEWMQALLVPDD